MATDNLRMELGLNDPKATTPCFYLPTSTLFTTFRRPMIDVALVAKQKAETLRRSRGLRPSRVWSAHGLIPPMRFPAKLRIARWLCSANVVDFSE